MSVHGSCTSRCRIKSQAPRAATFCDRSSSIKARGGSSDASTRSSASDSCWSKRVVLSSALVLLLQPAALAQDNDSAIKTPREILKRVLNPSVTEKEPVLPATKKVKEYIQDIVKARPPAWQQIAQHIQKDEFIALSNDLVLSPFDDVRQACFFLPWALLNNDEINASSDARKAYDDLIDHIDDLDRVSRAAAAGQATPEKVQQAFFLLSATVDKFLGTVPRKYFA